MAQPETINVTFRDMPFDVYQELREKAVREGMTYKEATVSAWWFWISYWGKENDDS